MKPRKPLVMPRFADCISMLLHKRDDVDELRTTTYFLTRGWIDGEDNLDAEYERILEKRGPERTKKIIDAMYGHSFVYAK